MYTHDENRGSVWLVVIIVLALVVIVGGLLFYDGGVAELPPEENAEPSDVGIDAVRVPLSDVDGLELSGEATIARSSDAEIEVTVRLTGIAEDANHPIHIHDGTCRALGEIVYPLSAVIARDNDTQNEGGAVEDGDDARTTDGEETDDVVHIVGESKTVIDISLDDLLLRLPLVINAHASQDDLETNVSCGAILRPGADHAAREAARASEKVDAKVWTVFDAGEPVSVAVTTEAGAINDVLALLTAAEFSLGEIDEGANIFRGVAFRETALVTLSTSERVLSVEAVEEDSHNDEADEE